MQDRLYQTLVSACLAVHFLPYYHSLLPLAPKCAKVPTIAT